MVIDIVIAMNTFVGIDTANGFPKPKMEKIIDILCLLGYGIPFKFTIKCKILSIKKLRKKTQPELFILS